MEAVDLFKVHCNRNVKVTMYPPLQLRNANKNTYLQKLYSMSNAIKLST
jgi:hypothetical protein